MLHGCYIYRSEVPDHGLSSIAAACLPSRTITLGSPAAAELEHCESNVGSPDNLKELKHGLVEGYLPSSSLPNSLELLPLRHKQAPPRIPWTWKQQKPRFPGTPRWDLAARDANKFSCCRIRLFLRLGVPISKEETPRLYTLLHRTLTDAGLATYRAKNRTKTSTFHRQQSTHAHLRMVNSSKRWLHPSGHCRLGLGVGLRSSTRTACQLVARGIEYGKSPTSAICIIQ